VDISVKKKFFAPARILTMGRLVKNKSSRNGLGSAENTYIYGPASVAMIFLSESLWD